MKHVRKVKGTDKKQRISKADPWVKVPNGPMLRKSTIAARVRRNKLETKAVERPTIGKTVYALAEITVRMLSRLDALEHEISIKE